MIMSFIVALVLGLIVNEVWAWLPALSKALLWKTSRICLPREMQDRMLEEWDRLLIDTPGNLWKAIRALDLCRGAFLIKIQSIRARFPREKWRGYRQMALFFVHMFCWTSLRSPQRYEAFLATFLHVDPSKLKQIKSLTTAEVERLGSEALLATTGFCAPSLKIPNNNLGLVCLFGKMFFTSLSIKVGNPLISDEKRNELRSLRDSGILICDVATLKVLMDAAEDKGPKA